MVVHQLDPFKVGEIRELRDKPDAGKVSAHAAVATTPLVGDANRSLNLADRSLSLAVSGLWPLATAAAHPAQHPTPAWFPPCTQARELLEAVAAQVQPIMRRRQLAVPLLSEFFPVSLAGWRCSSCAAWRACVTAEWLHRCCS